MNVNFAGNKATPNPNQAPAPNHALDGIGQAGAMLGNVTANPGTYGQTQAQPNMWHPTGTAGQTGSWHPTSNQNYGAQQQPLPQWGGAQQLGAQQSIEQQALGGGDDAQRTQDFLRALTAAGAGGNNGFANSGNPQAQQAAPLLGAPAQGNGNGGSVGYAGGFNGGSNGVTYDAAPAQRTFAPPGPQGPPPPQPLPSQGGATMKQPTFSFGGAGQSTNPGYSAPHPADPYQVHDSSQYQASGPSQYSQQAQSSQYAYQPQQQPQSQYSTQMLVSDERQKTAVKEADIAPFLGALGAHSYEYKDQKHGEGRFVSPMAQELEKTEIGRSAVVETPEGKMVNYSRLAGVQLSATAMLHRRIQALEKKIQLKGKK